MPTFVVQSGLAVAFDTLILNYSSGVLAMPSGEDLSDLETRLIGGSASILDGEAQFSPASGRLNVVTATSGWIGLEFA